MSLKFRSAVLYVINLKSLLLFLCPVTHTCPAKLGILSKFQSLSHNLISDSPNKQNKTPWYTVIVVLSKWHRALGVVHFPVVEGKLASETRAFISKT